MKKLLLLIFLSSLPATFVLSQPAAPATSVSSSAQSNAPVWQLTPLDLSSTEHRRAVTVTNAAGVLRTNVHRYISLATGKNYVDDLGNLRPSKDLIQLQADGSAALLQGPTKMHFSPTLSAEGAITLASGTNVFKTSPLGLFWFDAASGESAQISAINPQATAELHPPNTIVYKSALSCGDIRIKATKAGMEVDVILTSRPKAPESYSATLNSGTCRLELWHEWFGTPPPRTFPRVLQRETDLALRATMAEPDLIDEKINIANLWFPAGRAFSVSGSADTGTNAPAEIQIPRSAREGDLIPGKRWLVISGRTVLVESIKWTDILPQLLVLPELAGEPKPVSDARGLLAQAKPQGSAKPLTLNSQLSTRPLLAGRQLPPRTKFAQPPNQRVKLAGMPYEPKGFNWDYITVSGSGDFTFSSSTTYFVDGNLYTDGTVDFEPGCYVKFANWGMGILYGTIICNGTASSPSVLTSMNDEQYGEHIDGSTRAPTCNYGPAVWAYYIQNSVSLVGLKTRWAETAWQLDCGSSDFTYTVTDCAVEFCKTGLIANYMAQYYGDTITVTVQNSTQCGVGTALTTSTSDSIYFSGALTDVCGPDADHNGLPDQWEYTWFGHVGIDPNADPDGDGLTNFQEYVLGTNPTQAALPDNGTINLQLFTPLK